VRCGAGSTLIGFLGVGPHRLFSHSISTYACPSLPWSSLFLAYPLSFRHSILFRLSHPVQVHPSQPRFNLDIYRIPSRLNLRIRTYLLYIPQFRIAWLFLQGDLRTLLYTYVLPFAGGGWKARLCLRLPRPETCLTCRTRRSHIRYIISFFLFPPVLPWSPCLDI
jgi:hypothetical protein